LASRGIPLLRKDWNSKLEYQTGKTWETDEKHEKVKWMTNTRFEKQDSKKK
jgi:hypothetical protein